MEWVATPVGGTGATPEEAETAIRARKGLLVTGEEPNVATPIDAPSAEGGVGMELWNGLKGDREEPQSMAGAPAL